MQYRMTQIIKYRTVLSIFFVEVKCRFGTSEVISRRCLLVAVVL